MKTQPRQQISNTYNTSTVVLFLKSSVYEPRNDKTNKMSVRPAKTQIILGIRPHEETLGP